MNSSITPSARVQQTVSPGNRLGAIVAYALPVGLLALLVSIYLISPEFYLTYVLEARHRESQAVEIFTFACGLLATCILLYGTYRIWTMHFALGGRRATAGAAAIVTAITLGTLFFTGEEVSWGQSYFSWETPDQYAGPETNLHNVDFPIRVQALGSLFLIVMFLLLPLAWRFRRRLNLPAAWEPAIAPGPVVFAFICGFAWSRAKGLYMMLNSGPVRDDSRAYVEFIEQMKEHKELLFMVALLMYGLHVVGRLRLMSRHVGGAMHKEESVKDSGNE